MATNNTQPSFENVHFESLQERLDSPCGIHSHFSIQSMWNFLEENKDEPFFSYQFFLKLDLPEVLLKNFKFDDKESIQYTALWGATALKNYFLQLEKETITPNNLPLFILEDGFIRSITTFDETDAPRRFSTPLSMTSDTKAFHFDSETPSMLEDLLNSDETLSEKELKRATKNIESIKKNYISKYNHQPIYQPKIGREGAHKVLIIDQAYNDSSILKSSVSFDVFIKMLNHAALKNKESDIIIKIHPDMISNPKRGHAEKAHPLGHFTDTSIEGTVYRDESGSILHEHVYLFCEEINPISLLNIIDTTYVCSSLMGFESLLLGKETHIFGMPFYAGWGIGHVHNKSKHLERRTKERSVEEIFYFAYVTYSRYIHPLNLEVCEIEDAIDYLIQQRNRYFFEFEKKEHQGESALIKISSPYQLLPRFQDNIVKIAFCFDRNYCRQAIVAICSLLDASYGKCSYEIYCVCVGFFTPEEKEQLHFFLSKKPALLSLNLIDYITKDLFEIRNISSAAYVRLDLHQILPKSIDKIIYSDVDVLFKKDLFSVYQEELGNHIFAAPKDLILIEDSLFCSRLKNHFGWKEHFSFRKGRYYHSGFLLLNLQKIREEKMHEQWNPLKKNRYHLQDMDILNITCKGKILPLSPTFCVLSGAHPDDVNVLALARRIMSSSLINKHLSVSEFEEMKNPAILHYAGPKPWNSKSVRLGTVWWRYVYENLPELYPWFKERLELLNEVSLPQLEKLSSIPFDPRNPTFISKEVPKEAPRTLLYQAYITLLMPLLNERKKNKLLEKPEAFFKDAKNPITRIGQLFF